MSIAIVANPYHRTPTQTDHALRLTDIIDADPHSAPLEARAIADDAYLPVLTAHAAQIGYATALDDLWRDLASVGLPLAHYIAEFAATRGIEMEVK